MPVFYGVENKNASIWAEDIQDLGEGGMRFTLCTENLRTEVKTCLPGMHMVYNCLAAAGVGLKMELTPEQIRQGIDAMRTIAGRSNFIRKNGYTVIDDCYNANPMSMRAALQVLGGCSGRRIAVLGDMGELGAEEEKLHYELGRIVPENADLLFACGKLSEYLVRGARDAGMSKNVFYDRDKENMLSLLKTQLQPEDVVLVKASHFMGYQDIVEAL